VGVEDLSVVILQIFVGKENKQKIYKGENK